MEMVILEQKNCVRNSNSKIPEYARDFKNEWLFIRGIDKKCGEFIKRLDNVNDAYEQEEVFYTPLAKNLMNYFSKFLRFQKLGYIRNNSELYFKDIDIENITDLKVILYNIVLRLNESSFFQDFFESFIVFNYNIKTEVYIESESESESDDINDILSDSDSDSESESDIDINDILSDSD